MNNDPASDAALGDRARNGDSDAFAELWGRHAGAGRAIARSVAPSIDPDDLVADAYVNIYALVKRGGGPTGPFRPYLAAAIRNIATRIGRSRRETPIDFADELVDETTSDDEQMRKLDRDLTTTAFRSLPERWQQALWYSEVEDLSVKECAEIFGIKPTAMAMLTFRAREGLRDAWVQAHIARADPGPEHTWTMERLGAHTRENLTRLEAARLEAHLDGCESCRAIADEARSAASRLAIVLLPALLGTAAAAAYAEEIAHGGTSASAAAAAPLSVSPATSDFSSATTLQSALHQLQVVVGTSTVIALALASGATLADAPDGRPPVETSALPSIHGPSGSPVAGPTPFTAEADLGELGTYYPILSGTAQPGSLVLISLPGGVTRSTDVGDDGRWRSEQLEMFPGGTLSIENAVGGATVAKKSLDITVSTPTLAAETSGTLTTVTVRGTPGAGFAVSSPGDGPAIAAAVLDESGRWSGSFALPPQLDPGTLIVRYAAGKRFGPSEPAAGPTAGSASSSTSARTTEG